MKRDNWEGGHRVPFIARWPGKIQAGSASDQTINLTDVMATCAAVAGATLTSDSAEDSYDIFPVLLGKQGSTPVREYTLHQTIKLALAIRKGRWKYLDHKGSGGNGYDGKRLGRYRIADSAPQAPGQLYDLKADPGEVTNLSAKHPEVVQELKAQLEKYKHEGRSAPPRRSAAERVALTALPGLRPSAPVPVKTATTRRSSPRPQPQEASPKLVGNRTRAC